MSRGQIDVSVLPANFRSSIEEARRHVIARLLARLFKGRATPRKVPLKGVHRVLVVRPNHRLGNTLLITPLIADIERAYPGAEIDIVCAGLNGAEVFRGFKSVRHVIALPRKMVRHIPTVIRLLHRLRSNNYDVAVDPCVGSNSGRLLLMMARATHKIGFAREVRAQSISCAIAIPPMPVHIAQLPVYLLRASRGEVFQSHICPRLDLRLSGSERKDGSARLQRVLGGPGGNGPVVGLYAAATGAKAFDETWWMAVVHSLISASPTIQFVEIVPGHGVSALSNRFPSYFSTSIRGLAAFMAALDAVISADCGVMHLAVASGTHTTGVFKITETMRYAPYGGGSFAIAASDHAPEVVSEAILARSALRQRDRMPIAHRRHRAPRELPQALD